MLEYRICDFGKNQALASPFPSAPRAHRCFGSNLSPYTSQRTVRLDRYLTSLSRNTNPLLGFDQAAMPAPRATSSSETGTTSCTAIANPINITTAEATALAPFFIAAGVARRQQASAAEESTLPTNPHCIQCSLIAECALCNYCGQSVCDNCITQHRGPAHPRQRECRQCSDDRMNNVWQPFCTLTPAPGELLGNTQLRLCEACGRRVAGCVCHDCGRLMCNVCRRIQRNTGGLMSCVECQKHYNPWPTGESLISNPRRPLPVPRPYSRNGTRSSTDEATCID